MNTRLQIEITAELAQFRGTESYQEYTSRFGKMMLTEGCSFLLEKLRCEWLYDTILDLQKYVAVEEFQTWKLVKIEDGYFELVVEDGNDRALLKQEIYFVNCNLNELTLWFIDGILLLPQEY